MQRSLQKPDDARQAYVQRFQGIRAHLSKNKSFLQETVGKHLDSERMIRLALSAASTNPLLLEATPQSIMVCLMDCARLGLEPTGRGGVWLVPFKKNERINGKKTGRYVIEAQAITDYRGELALARRSGDLLSVTARPVYEKERFEFVAGDEERLVHEPVIFGERGKLRGVYAIARLKDGGIQRAVMSLQDVQARRDRSRAKDNGPWVTDFEKMALKTVLRELLNLCPMSTEYREYVEREEAREDAARTDGQPVIDLTPELTSGDAEPSTEPPALQEPERPRSKRAAEMAAQMRQDEPAEPEPATPEQAPPPAAEAPTPPPQEEEEDSFAAPPEPSEDADLNKLLGQLFAAQKDLVEAFEGDADRAKRLWRQSLPLDLDKYRSADAAKKGVTKAGTALKKATLAVTIEGLERDLRELDAKVPDRPAEHLEDMKLGQLESIEKDRRRRLQAAQGEG